MLEKPCYMTTGAQQQIQPEIVEVMLGLVERLKKLEIEIDYLQVFNLTVEAETQMLRIIHTQEVPEYVHIERIQLKYSLEKDTYKLFSIDDGEYATLMLAEEY